MILAHDTRIASQLTLSSMALLPIVPILLFPFILVFFVVVVPIWGLSLGVVGLALLLMRGLRWLASRAGVHTLDGPTDGVHRAFRWVLTFGGFTER